MLVIFLGWDGGIRSRSATPKLHDDDQSSSEDFPQTVTDYFRPLMPLGDLIPDNQVIEIDQAKTWSISMAGMEGFEPPNAGTRNQCLTTWRHPIIICS